jgi:long-chain fatty acid transport protein
MEDPMKKLFNKLTLVVVGVSLFAAGNVFATNGYFTHGIGTKNKGMAGAGIAMPEDAIDITNNPAVAAVIGNHTVLGAALFSPRRKYETTSSDYNGQGGSFTIGPNKLKSDSNYFVIPHIARNWQLDNGNAIGVAFYGRGGMNTDWNGGTATFDPDGPGEAPVMTLDGTYGAGKAGVNMSQAFLDVTWGKAFNEHFAIGAAGVFVAQMFKANGVGSFAGFTETFAASGGTALPENLSNNGTDWSYGAGFKLGFHSQISDSFSFGMMYQSKIWMSEWDDYADLFAQQGDFDIPPNLKLGLTFRPNDTVALSFDIDHIWYSDTDSVGNSIMNIFACPTAGQMGTDLSQCLGGDNGAGFGWEDMTVFKAGVAWKAGEDWTWRLGYSYGKQPIPNSELTFNILAPGTVESHITAGFTLNRTPNRDINVSVMYAPSKSVTGAQNFDPSQDVTIAMHQFELEFSYGWRF